MAKKTLKHKTLIDSLELSIHCPDQNCKEVDSIAYRWVRQTFDDGQSFLPNYIYDQNRGKKPRKNDKGDEFRCGMCGLSFFESIMASEAAVESIGGPEKVMRLLQYTHLAEGKLFKETGLAGDIDDTGHYLFFEYENVVLEEQFKILQPI